MKIYILNMIQILRNGTIRKELLSHQLAKIFVTFFCLFFLVYPLHTALKLLC